MHGRVIERKYKPDGSIREYECDLVWLDRRVAVVRFELRGGGGAFALPVAVPVGTVSWGYFWARRPYNAYRFVAPGGDVLAHRFDAVADVRLGQEMISYRDLALDWWALTDGQLLEEDRDEFEELLAAGQLSAADGARAADAARQVTSRYRHIIDEIETLERRVIAS